MFDWESYQPTDEEQTEMVERAHRTIPNPPGMHSTPESRLRLDPYTIVRIGGSLWIYYDGVTIFRDEIAGKRAIGVNRGGDFINVLERLRRHMLLEDLANV